MKAKFLIPEIDKKRFAENLSEEMRRSKLELKSLTEIGVEEVSTASIWQYREGIKFPTINRFLTLCRFFTKNLFVNSISVRHENDRHSVPFY